MTILAFILHLLLNFLLGNGILSLLKKEKLPFGQFFIAMLIGVVAETMISFTLMWGGVNIYIALGVNILLALGVNIQWISTILINRTDFSKKVKKSLAVFSSLKIYDYLLLLLIFQKIGIVIWQLFRTPTMHSDALKHWSTQGRLIYGQINFSLIPDTSKFLGWGARVIQDYPLQVPIWRANSAILNNGWNEFVSRSDGLLFFISICGIVGSVMWMLTKKRWIALGAVFIIASLPLQVWHGAGGYADIAVEAFLVSAIACFISKELLLCGIMTAGAIWSKNDGAVLYFIGILVAILTTHFIKKEVDLIEELKNLSRFFAGFAAVLPWLIFQNLYSVPVFGRIMMPITELFSFSEFPATTNDYQVVLTKGPLAQNPPSLSLFWDHVFTGSSFGIFWIMICLGLLILSKRLLSDSIGRALVLFFIITASIIYYIFTFTPAYEYLLTQTTIHRVLLQFSAAAFLVIGYGISLQMKIDNLKK